MYISGSLISKTINFYKPTISDFDMEGIVVKGLYLSYNGELIMQLWNRSLEKKLIKRQEDLIIEEKEKTLWFSATKFKIDNSYLNKILKIITETNRKYSYVLFECLYKIIISENTLEEIITRINELELFINWLNKEDVNQINLDILISLFLERKVINYENLKKAKLEKFHLDEDDILSDNLKEIIYFGEFVSPNRVAKIARSINENIEYSKLVLPLYFAIPSEINAAKFLKLCQTPILDEKQIKRNARLLRIPSSLENLIR